MAQNFVGSNNIHLLDPIGQFGTRLQGGKDSGSPRYIFTRLLPVVKTLFNEHDNLLLDYLDDDGMSIEPKYYIPLIPMLLVNGAEGIGTGFSTTVLQYNPLQIIDNLLLMMDNKPVKEMYPWFKGFKGKVEKVENGFNVRGTYKIDKENSKIVISELPVGTWTTKYKEYLDKLEEDKVIKGFKDKNTDETVYIEIQFTDDNLDNDQVEYIDSRPNGSYDSNVLGDFSQFITRWDSAYLKVLQETWDYSNYVPGPKKYDTDFTTGEMILIKESIEDKTARLGPRPTSYTSS
jgi:DNA topoisomerase-2